jgi:hypothetical protein
VSPLLYMYKKYYILYAFSTPLSFSFLLLLNPSFSRQVLSVYNYTIHNSRRSYNGSLLLPSLHHLCSNRHLRNHPRGSTRPELSSRERYPTTVCWKCKGAVEVVGREQSLVCWYASFPINPIYRISSHHHQIFHNLRERDNRCLSEKGKKSQQSM